VEDARFCHRCGRPTREDEQELAAAYQQDQELQDSSIPPTAPAPASPEIDTPPPAEVSFRNGVAVRAGFLAAALIQLVLMITALTHLALLLPLVLCFGGAYSVFLFRRRSGRGVSVMEGARLGWITGVFSFVISTVLFTAGLLASGRGLAAMMQESMNGAGVDAATVTKALDLLRQPQYVGIFVILMLAFNFVMVTVVCSLGGAVGARFTARERP
jgi:hypothetical protein